MFGFEKLEVWQEAVAIAEVTYLATRDFPADERFGLTSQMRRCSVSISSNIAEGSGRVSKPEFARFVAIAYGSLLELVSQSKIALKQQFLKQKSHNEIYRRAEQLARMLSGLRNNLVRQD